MEKLGRVWTRISSRRLSQFATSSNSNTRDEDEDENVPPETKNEVFELFAKANAPRHHRPSTVSIGSSTPTLEVGVEESQHHRHHYHSYHHYPPVPAPPVPPVPAAPPAPAPPPPPLPSQQPSSQQQLPYNRQRSGSYSAKKQSVVVPKSSSASTTRRCSSSRTHSSSPHYTTFDTIHYASFNSPQPTNLNPSPLLAAMPTDSTLSTSSTRLNATPPGSIAGSGGSGGGGGTPAAFVIPIDVQHLSPITTTVSASSSPSSLTLPQNTTIHENGSQEIGVTIATCNRSPLPTPKVLHATFKTPDYDSDHTEPIPTMNTSHTTTGSTSAYGHVEEKHCKFAEKDVSYPCSGTVQTSSTNDFKTQTKRRSSVFVKRGSVSMEPVKRINLDEVYEVQKQVRSTHLGTGRFGCVKLAQHKESKCKIAIKFFPRPQTKQVDFIREYNYSFFLSPHPNIIDSYEGMYQTDDDSAFFFVQEFCPYASLREAVESSQNGIGETATKAVMSQLLAAIEFMHSENLVHRNLKAENVLIFDAKDFSKVKLTDFGLTRKVDSTVKYLEYVNNYHAPELCETVVNEVLTVNRSIDIWAIGIIFYYCLKGRFPWQKATIMCKPYWEWEQWLKRKNPLLPKRFEPFNEKSLKLLKRTLNPRHKDRWSAKDIRKCILKEKFLKSQKVSSEDV